MKDVNYLMKCFSFQRESHSLIPREPEKLIRRPSEVSLKECRPYILNMHSICQQIWKTKQWPQDWKRSVFIPIPKKGNAKECSNYCTIVLMSHASKIMLKILQARLEQYVNCELPDVQAGFRKGRGTRDQIANIHWMDLALTTRPRVPEKHLFLLY